jgi:uncharacterized protein (TIGR02265 family)
MGSKQEIIIESLAPHCDIVARLAAVPPWARVRGVYFRAALQELTRRGLRPAFDKAFEEPERATFTLYPVTDYLVRIAYAGTLITSPERVHEGLHELFRGNAHYFAQSLLGRGLLRLIARDPVRQLHQAIKSKRAVSNYGRWSVIAEEPGMVEVLHEDEYVWIESALAGGALGGFEACGVYPSIELRMRDAYNGSVIFRW